MRVAVVHYHLRGGGVTRVIERALAAVDGVAFAVLSGSEPEPGFAFMDDVRVVPELEYAGSGEPTISPDSLVERLRCEAKARLGAEPDVWHFHNHSLGKNHSLTQAVSALAQRGRLLLQIHDFAEDGRPALFRRLLEEAGALHRLACRLYLLGDNVHYATLNSRDRAFLAKAGVPEPNLHLLSNPVALDNLAGDTASAVGLEKQRLFLYCTRAIRRKNIGEFLFWSALAGADERFAVTLAPDNPSERARYEEWVGFATRLGLPIDFEAGGSSLESLIRDSFASVTTSVAEGFGLAFLESWLLERPVFGRKLPAVTDEFEAAGVDLSCLYDSLLLPLEREERVSLIKRLRERFVELRSSYQWPASQDEIELASTVDWLVDFARLDEELQRKLIERALSSSSFKSNIQPQWLVPDKNLDSIIQKNKRAVLREFGLEQYGRRLKEVYLQVANSKIEAPSGCADLSALLDEFLAPDRFLLLRS